MTNFTRSNFQAHPFHLVSPSPWPIFTCISLLTLTTSGVLTMHGFANKSLYSTDNHISRYLKKVSITDSNPLFIEQKHNIYDLIAKLHGLYIKPVKCIGVYIISVIALLITTAVIINGVISWNYIIFLTSCIDIKYIYIYLLNIPLLLCFVSVYNYLLKKVLLSEVFSTLLSKQFKSLLANKIKLRDIFTYIFSFKFFKISMLTISALLLANMVWFLHFGTIIQPMSLMEWLFYILYISICSNASICYINTRRFFTKFNMCLLSYSFILLLSAKLSVLFTMSYVIHCLFYCSIMSDNVSYCASKGLPDRAINTSLNKFSDFNKNILNFLNRLPVIGKLIYTKSNNYHCLNPITARFKHNSLSLNRNNLGSLTTAKAKPAFYVWPAPKNRPVSVVISAISSLEKPRSCLVFTYSNIKKVNSIYIDRFCLMDCPYLSTKILVVHKLGYLPKLGYLQQPVKTLVIRTKPLENTLDVKTKLAEKTLVLKTRLLEIPHTSTISSLSSFVNSCKVNPSTSLSEKEVYTSTINYRPEISLSHDITHLLPGAKSKLDTKMDDYITNISPDLLNPFVFMMSIPNQDLGESEINQPDEQEMDKDIIMTDDEQSDTGYSSQKKKDEIPEQYTLYMHDLTSISKAIDFVLKSGNISLQDSTRRTECKALDHLMSEYKCFFVGEEGKECNTLEALDLVNSYLTEQRTAYSLKTTAYPEGSKPSATAPVSELNSIIFEFEDSQTRRDDARKRKNARARVQSKIHYQNNKYRIQRWRKSYYEKNREKLRKQNIEYYDKNKDSILEARRLKANKS